MQATLPPLARDLALLFVTYPMRQNPEVEKTVLKRFLGSLISDPIGAVESKT